MRIVFSDLDGTLLTSDKRLSPRTVAALDRLAEAGIEFAPCSGRPLVGLLPELLAHPAVHYAVCANGALVCRVGEVDASAELGAVPSGEVLHREDMGAGPVLALYDVLKDRDVLFDVFGDGGVYVERARFERMDRFGLSGALLAQMRRMRTPMDATIPEIVAGLRHVERVSVYWRHREDRELATRTVESMPGLTWVSSLPTNVEVSSERATKGAALQWLCDYLGIPVSEAVAFGDGLNDATMLAAAGDGVAMANAVPEALAAANHTCDSNDADGVARYLEGLLG